MQFVLLISFSFLAAGGLTASISGQTGRLFQHSALRLFRSLNRMNRGADVPISRWRLDFSRTGAFWSLANFCEIPWSGLTGVSSGLTGSGGRTGI